MYIIRQLIMKREQLHKWLINGVAIVFCLALLSAGGMALINRYGSDTDNTISEEQTNALVKAWRVGMTKDDSKRTVLLAERIVGNPETAMPDVAYLQFFRRLGINSLALTANVNQSDYLHWRDAMELQQLAERIVNSPDVALEELFAVVNAEIRLSEQDAPTYLIADIWRRKSGTPEDRLRLLGGLAAYFGYQMLIVYLPDATGRPFYPLAEFHKNGHTAVADILCSRIYRNVRVAEMTPPDDWHAELKAAIRRPLVYFIPAEFADYRNVTRNLFERLADAKVKNLPVVTVSAPRDFLDFLIKEQGVAPDRIFFWPYPLQGALKSSLFPNSWRGETVTAKVSVHATATATNASPAPAATGHPNTQGAKD